MIKAFIALQLSKICKTKVDCQNCSLLPLCRCEEKKLEKMARNEGKVWVLLLIISVLAVIYALIGFF